MNNYRIDEAMKFYNKGIKALFNAEIADAKSMAKAAYRSCDKPAFKYLYAITLLFDGKPAEAEKLANEAIADYKAATETQKEYPEFFLMKQLGDRLRNIADFVEKIGRD